MARSLLTDTSILLLHHHQPFLTFIFIFFFFQIMIIIIIIINHLGTHHHLLSNKTYTEHSNFSPNNRRSTIIGFQGVCCIWVAKTSLLIPQSVMIVDTAFNQSHLVQSNRQTINGQWVSWSFDRKIVRKQRIGNMKYEIHAHNWKYKYKWNTNTKRYMCRKVNAEKAAIWFSGRWVGFEPSIGSLIILACTLIKCYSCIWLFGLVHICW